MYDYNTSRDSITLREYGRNIQNLVRYVSGLAAKDQRNAQSQSLLKIMKSINPKVRCISEDSRKLWDDLFIISDYSLDVESPYPVPEKDILASKISRLDYKTEPIKYRHYGRNVELLIQNAFEAPDEDTRLNVIKAAMRIMRSFNTTKNSDGSDIDIIIDNIKEIVGEEAAKVDFEAIKADMIKVRTQNTRPKPKGSPTYSKNRS